MCFTWFNAGIVLDKNSLDVFSIGCNCNTQLSVKEVRHLLERVKLKSSTGAPVHGLRVHAPDRGSLKLLAVEVSSYGEYTYSLRTSVAAAFDDCHDVITRRMTGLPRDP